MAQASSGMMAEMDRKKDSGNSGAASKVLRTPDSFESDGPLKYAAWKKQFTNCAVMEAMAL